MTLAIESTLSMFPKIYNINDNIKGSNCFHDEVSKSSNLFGTRLSDNTIPTFDTLYTKTRQVSHGVDSSIWECIHNTTGTRFCVKVLSMERNEAEIRFWIYREVKHTHIVQVHEILMEMNRGLSKYNTGSYGIQPKPIRSSNGNVYIIMSTVADSNLQTYMAMHQQHYNGKLISETDIQELTVQILQGLQYLHETCKVRHGGICPSNILIQNNDNCNTNNDTAVAIITDFGSATRNPLITPIMINSTVASNTIPYQAPELATTLGKQSSKSKNVKDETLLYTFNAADMWSLGATVYFMFTGRAPIYEKNVIHIPTTLPRNAKMFLISCFQYDPTIRITASEALQHQWLQPIMEKYTRTSIGCQVNFDDNTTYIHTSMDSDSIKIIARNTTRKFKRINIVRFVRYIMSNMHTKVPMMMSPLQNSKTTNHIKHNSDSSNATDATDQSTVCCCDEIETVVT